MQYAEMWKLMRKSYYLRLRYIVMEVKSSHYLIDIDSPSFRWGYICPVIHWIIPHKAHKINLPSSEINRLFLNKELEEDKKDRRKMRIKDWTLFILLIIILRVLNIPILVYSHLSPFVSYFLLMLGISVLVGLRIFISKKNEKVLNIIGAQNLSEIKISLVPDSPLEILKIMFVFIGVILFALFGFMLFSTIGSDPGTGNLWVGYGAGVLCFTLYLFINIILISNRNYRVKFRKIDSHEKSYEN